MARAAGRHHTARARGGRARGRSRLRAPCSPGSDMRALLVACLLAASLGGPARAQQAHPSLVCDRHRGGGRRGQVDFDGNYATGVTLDAVVSADFGRGFQGIVRPFASRLASGEWIRQVWVATARYERAARIRLRVDAGLIPSPIGLANLTLRPHLNPTMSQPSSLFTPLPPLEPRGARANAARRGVRLRRPDNRVGRALGRARGGHRHVRRCGRAASLRRPTRRDSPTW